MLAEKYRPKRLAQVVGQNKVVRALSRLIHAGGFDRGAFWLEGPTGTGKTSIAQAVARELGAEPGSWQYEEMDGDKCNVDAVRDLDEKAARSGHGLFAHEWRIWIVNEAHSMTPKAVQAWLTLLERLPKRWLVIFTTTESTRDLFGNFTQPFIDRTISFRLTNQGLCEKFARLAYRVAAREGLNGQPAEKYKRLVQDNHNSLRGVYVAIEKGAMLTD